MILGRIITHDVHSGMSVQFYRVDKTGCTQLEDELIFPGHTKGESRLSILLKTMLKEFPTDKFAELAKAYNVLDILGQTLAPVSVGSLSER